jgi:hypothetical protein
MRVNLKGQRIPDVDEVPKTKSMGVLMTIMWALVIALVLMLCLRFGAKAQGVQLGCGPIDLSKPFTTANIPNFYVDTCNFPFYKNDKKKKEWYYVRKINGTPIDTVWLEKVCPDTVIVKVGNITDTIRIFVNGVYTSPENYLSAGSMVTMGQQGLTQAQIDATYPGVGATVNDTRDWVAGQVAIDEATKGKRHGVEWKRTDYYINRGWVYKGISNESFTFLGNYTTIHTTNNNPFAIISTIRPTDQSQADAIVSRNINVVHFYIKGQSNQTGLELNCMNSGHVYQNWIYNCLEGVHLNFCMGSKVELNITYGCKYAYTSDIGTWKGFSPYMSQSNVTIYTSNVDYSTDPDGISYRVYGTTSCKIEHATTQGEKAKQNIDFDSKGFGGNYSLEVDNYYNELKYGLTNCGAKLRCVQMIFWAKGWTYMKDAALAPGAYMLDSYSSTGQCNVVIEGGMEWKRRADGKLFYNGGGTTYALLLNKFVLSNEAAAGLFAGVPVTWCPNPPQCGYNSYKIIDFPQ